MTQVYLHAYCALSCALYLQPCQPVVWPSVSYESSRTCDKQTQEITFGHLGEGGHRVQTTRYKIWGSEV